MSSVTADPFSCQITFPSEESMQKLRITDIGDFGFEETRVNVDSAVSHVIEEVNTASNDVIEVIGLQMNDLKNEFEDFLEITTQLFAALSKLSDQEEESVNNKREVTLMMLKRLETSIGYIRKLN